MKRLIPANAYRADIGQRLGTERDAAGRVWCQVFPLGEWHRKDFPDGHLNLTADLLAQFIANWRAAGSPALPVDYEHEETGPASGWIEDLRQSPAGELEGAIKWTDEAAADIKADKRRYLSPTWAMQHVDRRTGEPGGPWLYGAALTNSPFYDSMPRVAATATSVAETTQPTQTKERRMLPELKKRMAAALKCAEDCSDEDMVTAIEAKCASQASASDVEGKLTAAVKTAADEAVKLTARIAALEADKAKHEKELFTRDFEAVFEAGLKAGRVGLPAMKDTLRATAEAMGLPVVKTLIDSMAPVALAPVGVAGAAGGSTGDAAKTAEAEITAFVEEKMKAGATYIDAMRAANIVKRDVVERAFSSTNSTKPPVQG